MSKLINTLAAPLTLEYDHKRMSDEMIALMDRPDCQMFGRSSRHFQTCIDAPLFNKDEQQELRELNYYSLDPDGKAIITESNAKYPGKSIYLRHDTSDFSSTFLRTKYVPHEMWSWRDDLDIPYTREYINSLSFFKKIGMIRVFMFKDTYLPTHRDYGFDLPFNEYSANHEYCLGLSLIPSTGGVPMRIWSETKGKPVEIYGNAMLFNDSVPHAVPLTHGYRITVRVFGEIDYNVLDSYGYVDHTNCYFL